MSHLYTTPVLTSISHSISLPTCEGIVGVVVLLTRRQLDLQSGADQPHECGGEVHRVVLGDGHVHPHQTLGGEEGATHH